MCIVIVVFGLGISQIGMMCVVCDLLEEVMFVFVVNGNSFLCWVLEVCCNGYEVLLQVLMELFDYLDNNFGFGMLVILKGMVINMVNLYQDMVWMDSYIGIMNYFGGKFLVDFDVLELVMCDLVVCGFMFLDDGLMVQLFSGQFVGVFLVLYVFVSLMFDIEVNQIVILKKLDDFECMVVCNGMVIGVVVGFDESIVVIKKWVDDV